jgi:hypothetical protein
MSDFLRRLQGIAVAALSGVGGEAPFALLRGRASGLDARGTDLRDAHLLSLLLGIPHAVLDNSSGKLGRFLDAWTGGAEGVHYAASAEDAEDWAAAMVSGIRR